MAKKEKLFGFNMVDASALLLFVFALLMLFFGLFELYTIFTYYNATEEIPVVYTVIFILLMTFAIYIMYKTILHRKRN